MRFEDAFKEDRELPLHEAADFFAGIKKFAEWTDPPDMTGQLEGMFNVPVEQVLDKLKEVIAIKFRKMVAYYTYAQSFRDHAWRAIKIEFGEHAEDEQEDAEFYVKRAVALGGPVHMDDIHAPPPSNNPYGILKMMARAEQEAIAAQRELLKLVGDENPMRVGIDEALGHDQHHLDEMWQIMTQEEQQNVEMPEAAAPMAEEEAPVEEAMEAPEESALPQAGEAPEQEVVASMRMAKVAKRMFAIDPRLIGVEGSPEEQYMATRYAAPGHQSILLHGTQPEQINRTAQGLHDEYVDTQTAPAATAYGITRGALGAGIGGLTGAGIGALLGKGKAGPGALIGLAGGGALGAGYGAFKGRGRAREEAEALQKAYLAAGKQARGGNLPRSPENLPADHFTLKLLRQKAEEDAAKRKTKPPELGDEKTAADKSDSDLRETGRQRGVSSLAAEAEREKGRRGERVGKTLGTLGGGVGGALLGRKYIGGKAGTIAGLAAGALAGRGAGKEVGTEIDVARNEAKKDLSKKAAAMHADLLKMAEGEEAPMASPTAQELEPTNYLEAEMAGRQAQEANESAFYREQLGQAKAEAQQMQQQVADAQTQLQQVQEQAAQAGQQIEAASQQAVAAQDAATQQTLEAAKARIGAQEMRAKMLELVSQDPQVFGEAAMGPQMGVPPPGAPPGSPPQVGPGGEPMAPPGGEPGGVPAGGAPPAAAGPPPGGGGAAAGPPAPPPQGAPMGPPEAAQSPSAGGSPEQQKMGSWQQRAVGAGVGALSGAGSALYAGYQAPVLEQKAREMAAKPRDGSFRQAAELAAAQQAAIGARLSQEHPTGSAIAGGLQGALLGGMAGPSVINMGKRVVDVAPDAARGLGRMIAGG